MANKVWIGNAHATKQIQTITVGGTWAGTETATITCNGKDITITLVTNVTTANVATALYDAFRAATRLDGTGSTDATSNIGGQEFGEFSEITVSVNSSVVTLVGNTAGKPFTVTVSQTSTSGTLALATSQACTGPHHWNNADNWDSGTVPANDDVVYFRNCDVSCKYGLPNASLEVTVIRESTFTADIGLPPVNKDNASKPYAEYRQRYVRLDDSGGSSNVKHRFFYGTPTTHSQITNVRHATVKCTPEIYSSVVMSVLPGGARPINIICSANTSTITITGGAVDCGDQDSATAAWSEMLIVGNSNVRFAGAPATVEIGDSATVYMQQITGTVTSLLVHGGRCFVEDSTATFTAVSVRTANGYVAWNCAATISALTVTNFGTFDASLHMQGFTLANTYIFGPASVLDPNQRITFSNPMQCSGFKLKEANFDFGTIFTLDPY